MSNRTLLVHPADDMVVALVDHAAGERVLCGTDAIELLCDIPAKHKFARYDFSAGQKLKMYGIIVGEATRDIRAGELITTGNLQHATEEISTTQQSTTWYAPEVLRWQSVEFNGYVRPDGRVGVRNYWIVVPLVYCQNRNLDVLRQALSEELGYSTVSHYHRLTRRLVERYRSGQAGEGTTDDDFELESLAARPERVFPHVDGVKFLRHELGCGGTYGDAISLCGLLAGYINHPNVAGATVLSLGCQKSQIKDLQHELQLRNPNFDKPLLIFEQQQMPSEKAMLNVAIRETLAGLAGVNEARRQPAPLSQLTLGVECGASDGFSGLSANPAIGHCSDLLVALGGSVILSEFPELAGCEQNLADRCVTTEIAQRFLKIMHDYDQQALLVGGSFATNPSPGNIRDGLITDAMKSAGAAKKGGTSPVVDVLDYPEPIRQRGLNLLCTPGADVESTTAMAGSGATVQFFSTGLGTPTGNPITPVVKISTNTHVAEKMSDIIDFDAGTIISGKATLEQVGAALLQEMIDVANGKFTKAELLGQDDFIPWKRGISF